jgi:hypothetical protein
VESCTLAERTSAPAAGRPVVWTDERQALGWAEIAGLVDIFPDGSWAPTSRAIECLEREDSDDPADVRISGSCN